MLRAEKELDKEINALIRKAEILDAQEDRRYGFRRQRKLDQRRHENWATPDLAAHHRLSR